MIDDFPAIWRRSKEQNQILEILRTRLKVVGQRTAIYNRLQALAHSVGLPKGKMRTIGFQNRLKESELDEAGSLQRKLLFNLLGSFNQHIAEPDQWLGSKADGDLQVQLLMTQKGVGYLTALALVNILGDISRFDRVPKQVTNSITHRPV